MARSSSGWIAFRSNGSLGRPSILRRRFTASNFCAAATEAISHSPQGLRCGRLESLTIHAGRHTLISHALAGGRSLPKVRDAVGHGNVSITSGYRHVAVDDDAKVGIVFRFRS